MGIEKLLISGSYFIHLSILVHSFLYSDRWIIFFILNQHYVFLSACVYLQWQASCGQSGLLTSVRRRSTTPGYEVCCSVFFTCRSLWTIQRLPSISCTYREWLCCSGGWLDWCPLNLWKKMKQCPLDKNIQCWPTATCEGQRLLLSGGRDRTVFFPANLQEDHHSTFQVAVGRNPMSASSPPSLPRAFLHSLYPHHPSSPSSSPSPPGPLYTRLSNGSHSIPSPTNSRGSFHGVSFLLQIGLTRETVNLEASDLSLSAVKDLVCSIVDQKVRVSFHFERTFLIKPFFPPNIIWHERFSTNTCKPVTQLVLNFNWRADTMHTSVCFAPFYHIHLFRFYFPKQTSGPRAP